MLRRSWLLLFDRLSLIHSATLSLIVLLLFSLIGGIVIYASEEHRDVHSKTLIVGDVTLTPDPELGVSPRHETHTFVKDVEYRGERFIDALFTSVSALTVTGLVSTDFSQFTTAGQVVVLFLIQIGGMGIILFSSIFFIALARGLSRRDSFKTILSGILDTPARAVQQLLWHITLYTVFFEFFGFLVLGLYTRFFADQALLAGYNPWWWSLFHSISAFNNAGFSLVQNNLTNFAANPVVMLTIAFLIIVGGLGFPVLVAIHNRLFFRFSWFRSLNIKDIVASEVQIKVVITGTIVLLLAGTLFFFIIDGSGPAFVGYSWAQRLLIAFFHSVSSRTAGFNTIDVSLLSTASIFFLMILMFIGANPAGTSGGIKIPTLVVLYGYIKDWFQPPRQPVRLFHRNISRFSVSHAIRIFFASILFLLMIATPMLILENQYLMTPDPVMNLQKILFEIVSAFGTVGMSLGFTGANSSFAILLSPFSKVLLMITMIVGRLGTLVILAALFKRKISHEVWTTDYPDAQRVQVG